jgi:hypothetical protein
MLCPPANIEPFDPILTFGRILLSPFGPNNILGSTIMNPSVYIMRSGTARYSGHLMVKRDGICFYGAQNVKRISNKWFGTLALTYTAPCFNIYIAAKLKIWGYGAVGSASEWHSEGQGFESPYLHQYYQIGRRNGVLFLFFKMKGQ